MNNQSVLDMSGEWEKDGGSFQKNAQNISKERRFKVKFSAKPAVFCRIFLKPEGGREKKKNDENTQINPCCTQFGTSDERAQSKFANTDCGQPSLGALHRLNINRKKPTEKKGFFPSKGVSGWSVLTKFMSVSLATSVVMYSPEAMQYCANGIMEVQKFENDFVLDLRVRTQETPNAFQERTEESFNVEQIFTMGLHSPEVRVSQINEANCRSLSPTVLPLTPNTTTRNGKPTRPFKAYPKNFLGLATAEGIVDDSDMRFLEFRRQCLSQIHATTGSSTGNKNMKRPVQSIRPTQSVSPTQLPSSSIKDQTDFKDQAYWERRRKNNEAAKKSRDARRAKEDEIAIRAAFLERENLQLRLELASLKGEVERLRCVLYGKK